MVILDKILEDFGQKLNDKLSWLNEVYGIAVQSEAKAPRMHTGNGEYVTILPDDKKGNYAFFDIVPEYLFDHFTKHTSTVIRVRFGLVIWCDLRTVYADPQDRTNSQLKTDVLKVMERISLKYGEYVLTFMSDEAFRIFARYAKSDFQDKYLMFPYAGLRIDGNLVFSSGIKLPTPTPTQ